MGHHIGVSIISTLLISLAVALLFIPMATYTVLRSRIGARSFIEKSVCHAAAGTNLSGVVEDLHEESRCDGLWGRHPAVPLLDPSVSLNIQDRKEVESDRFSIYVTMPTGSTLENADQVVRVIEERLAGFPEKQDLISRIRETDAELTLVLKKDYRQIREAQHALTLNPMCKTRLRTIQRRRNITF